MKPVSAADAIGKDRALVIFGVKVEGAWNYPRFGINLDEFDAKTGKITGNCWVHTHASATVDSAPGAVRYFAFDVPPGDYVYSPFNGVDLTGGNVAFQAQAGKHTYLGEFVYEKNRALTLRQNLDDAKAAVGALFPELKDSLSSADTRIVRKPYIFLCTP